MATSPLKRQSGGGGRLSRLLASLRAPARAGPLPVQTGFPTSLADIVVKNHGRLRNPRRRQNAPAAGPPTATAAAEPAQVTPQRRELSVAHDGAARSRAPMPAHPGQVSIRPGLLAAGGAVALALLVVVCWSKQLVAAATFASVALSWIESSARTVTVRPRRPEEETEELGSRGRVSAESPRTCRGESGGSDDGGSVSDAASPWSADAGSGDLGCCDDDDTPPSSSVNKNNPKLKQSRRSLRKLLASKLRSGKTPRRATDTDSRHGERPETLRRLDAEPAEETLARAPEAITLADDERCRSHCQRGRALPLPALVPIILAGLVAGKLPALALAVLCAAFASSAERAPAGQGSR